MISGYCYHCIDCPYTHLMVEPAIDHSTQCNHGIIRRLRDNCEYHIKLKDML